MTDRPEGTPDETSPEATDATEPVELPDAGEEVVDEEIVEAEAEDMAAGDDEDDEDDLDEEEEADAAEAAAAAGAGAATGRGSRRPATTPAAHVPTPSERAVHVRDDVSKWFVIATVVVFLLILANGILLGRGGLLAPAPTERPSASALMPPRRLRASARAICASISCMGLAAPSATCSSRIPTLRRCSSTSSSKGELIPR